MLHTRQGYQTIRGEYLTHQRGISYKPEGISYTPEGYILHISEVYLTHFTQQKGISYKSEGISYTPEGISYKPEGYISQKPEGDILRNRGGYLTH